MPATILPISSRICAQILIVSASCGGRTRKRLKAELRVSWEMSEAERRAWYSRLCFIFLGAIVTVYS